jgi:hypothetical protein
LPEKVTRDFRNRMLDFDCVPLNAHINIFGGGPFPDGAAIKWK